MKLCVVIPAHNEAATIAQVIKGVLSKGLEAIVIDDGSSDRTGSIAREAGAFVITHDKKSGKGFSLREGFDHAVAHGYLGVIAMDGDGQHAVEDIDKFLQKASFDPHSVISGNRMENPKGMPFVRFMTNKIMSLMISGVCRQRVPDSQCGFRYMGTKVLKEIKLTSSDFEIESEVLIEASRKGFKLYSVGIKTIYQDELSKINPFFDTIRFVKYLFKQIFGSKHSR